MIISRHMKSLIHCSERELLLSRLSEGTREFFFSFIMISKMGVKMNFRIISKNHATDSKIRSPQNSILDPIELTSPTRQPGS